MNANAFLATFGQKNKIGTKLLMYNKLFTYQIEKPHFLSICVQSELNSKLHLLSLICLYKLRAGVFHQHKS